MQVDVSSGLPQLECYGLRDYDFSARDAIVTASFNLQVVGRTKTSQVMESAEGSSFNPTTSAPTGPMVVQKVPAQVPTIMAKHMRPA